MLNKPLENTAMGCARSLTKAVTSPPTQVCSSVRAPLFEHDDAYLSSFSTGVERLRGKLESSNVKCILLRSGCMVS